jgi:outer membrane protein OmpA-like peptidoglycan-associated protein
MLVSSVMRLSLTLPFTLVAFAFAPVAASPRTGPDFVGSRPPRSAVGPALAASDGTTRIAPSDDVWFPTESAMLGTVESDQVAVAATWLREHAWARVVIEGHADRAGSAAYNEDLATRRAVAVRDMLVGLGVAADRTVLVIFGSSDASDALHDASARRVVFYTTAQNASAIATASIDDRHAIVARWSVRGAQIEERPGMTSTPAQTIASRQ